MPFLAGGRVQRAAVLFSTDSPGKEPRRPPFCLPRALTPAGPARGSGDPGWGVGEAVPAPEGAPPAPSGPLRPPGPGSGRKFWASGAVHTRAAEACSTKREEPVCAFRFFIFFLMGCWGAVIPSNRTGWGQIEGYGGHLGQHPGSFSPVRTLSLIRPILYLF